MILVSSQDASKHLTCSTIACTEYTDIRMKIKHSLHKNNDLNGVNVYFIENVKLIFNSVSKSNYDLK